MYIQTYFKRLEAQVDVIDTVGGRIADYPDLATAELKEILGNGVDISTTTSDKGEKTKQTTKNQYMGCLAVMNLDMKCYSRLKTDLENNTVKGNQEWPQYLKESYIQSLSPGSMPTRASSQSCLRTRGSDLLWRVARRREIPP